MALPYPNHVSTPKRRDATRWVAVFIGALTLGACSCGGETTPPCESDTPPNGCGETCTTDAMCQAGLHCGADGTCTAECTAAGDECRSSEMCDARGVCVPRTSTEDGSTADATNDGGGGGDAGADSGDGDICQSLDVVADPVRPYILFIIDRSGSMNADFPYLGEDDEPVDCGDVGDCLDRWDSLEAVLVGRNSQPLMGNGVLSEFQANANLGIVTYTSLGDSGPTYTGRWPTLNEVPAALNNLTTIRSGYPANETNNGDTPTGESLWGTLCHLDAPFDSGLGCGSLAANTLATAAANSILVPAAFPAAPLLPPDRNPDAPIIFVLATDGEPDSSADPDPNNRTDALAIEAREWVLEAVREARTQANIKTYVISVADDLSSAANNHLGEVACEGGTGPNPATVANEPQCMNANPPASGGVIFAYDTGVLESALTNIIRDSIPCSFQLEGMVNDVALARANGEVTINDVPVPLDMANGWWLLDDGRTFTLNGTSCVAFRSSPGNALEASFACDSGVIIIIE